MVRINDAHPHHMRQADVLAVVRNRSSHTMHVVEAVRLRFHLLDRTVKVCGSALLSLVKQLLSLVFAPTHPLPLPSQIVPSPKEPDVFLLRFQVHVDPATCSAVSVDVYGGVPTSAVRDFYKLFGGVQSAAAARLKNQKKVTLTLSFLCCVVPSFA